jgi:hypothetical protein
MIDAIGWLGALGVLAAYILLSLGRLEARSFGYQGLNVAGSVLLIINTVYYGAYPSAFVNIVWLGIAVYALARLRR